MSDWLPCGDRYLDVYARSLTGGSTTRTSLSSAKTVTAVTRTRPAWRCTCPPTPSNTPSCTPVACATARTPRYVLDRLSNPLLRLWEEPQFLAACFLGRPAHLYRCGRSLRSLSLGETRPLVWMWEEPQFLVTGGDPPTCIGVGGAWAPAVWSPNRH